MGKKSKAPAAPDPTATARATQVGYFGPGGEGIRFGTQNANGVFTGRDNVDAYQVVESPFQQQFRQGSEGLMSNLLGNISSQGFADLPNSIDFSQVGELPTMEQFEPAAQKASSAALERRMQMLRPEFDRRQKKLDQQLANQGLPVGSEAFADSQSTLGSQINEAQSMAAAEADSIGRQEAQRQLANAMSLRQQRINDQLQNIELGGQNRQQILSELGGLTGLQFAQPQRTPMFNQGAASAINGAYANQLQAGQKNYSGLGSLLGTAGQLGAAWIMCAEEIKENKQEIDKDKILDAVKDMRVEEWNYIGHDIKHISPYAEEWKEKTGLGDGKTINIIDAFGVLMASVQAIANKVEKLESRLNA